VIAHQTNLTKTTSGFCRTFSFVRRALYLQQRVFPTPAVHFPPFFCAVASHCFFAALSIQNPTSMQFCPACDNKLYMRIGEYRPAASEAPEGKEESTELANAPLTLYCKHCPYAKNMHNDGGLDGDRDDSSVTDERHAFDPCMSRSNYSSNHPLYLSTVVNQYTHMDPTLPCLTVPCHNPQCVSNTDPDTESAVLYIRYNDQDMEFLYLCKHCRQCWHKNENGKNVTLFDFGSSSPSPSSSETGGVASSAK
jgi:hypothetical protein